MTQTMSAATPTRLVWNVGIRTNTIPNITGATPVMATLAPYELLQPGTCVTHSTDPVVCNVVRHPSINCILPDEVVLDPAGKKITTIAIDQSLDGGLTWTGLGSVGGWVSGPQNAPLHPGDPVPMPGYNTIVPVDGRTRIFRGRIDLPQALPVGIDITVV